MENKPCCPDPEIKTDPIYDPESEIAFNVNKEQRAKERMDICRECPELFGPLNNCRQCGCFMNIKTRIFKASCPLGKW